MTLSCSAPFCILLASMLASSFSLPLQAIHVEFMSKPYPRIELFPENIMKPYEASDFPWLQRPELALPSNFKYILHPFYLQSLNWLC